MRRRGQPHRRRISHGYCMLSCDKDVVYSGQTALACAFRLSACNSSSSLFEMSNRVEVFGQLHLLLVANENSNERVEGVFRGRVSLESIRGGGVVGCAVEFSEERVDASLAQSLAAESRGAELKHCQCFTTSSLVLSRSAQGTGDGDKMRNWTRSRERPSTLLLTPCGLGAAEDSEESPLALAPGAVFAPRLSRALEALAELRTRKPTDTLTWYSASTHRCRTDVDGSRLPSKYCRRRGNFPVSSSSRESLESASGATMAVRKESSGSSSVS